jgi:competence protein ComEC
VPPLVWIAVSWMAGLFVARQWLVPLGVEPVALILLCVIPLAAIVLWWDDRSVRLSGFCALALLVGALRCQAVLPDPDASTFLASYNDKGRVTMEGTIGDYPDVRDTWTGLSLEASRIEVDGVWQPVDGKALVYAPLYPEFHYGDRLRVSGRLETPAALGDSGYRDYLAIRGIYSLIRYPQIERLEGGSRNLFWTALYRFRDQARDVIARLLPDPEASLLQGIVLGIKGGIPSSLYDEYNATGTSHVIVISGSNITLISALLAAAFGRLLGKRRAYWFVIAGIAVYVLLVGADAAVVRAGVMGGMYVTAIYLGRRATAYVSVLASAALLTALAPLTLWDAGFQLSFAATLGLVLFSAPIEEFFERRLARFVPHQGAQNGLRYLNDLLVVTFAAQIVTLPLIVYHFGRLSFTSPLANLLILPVQPPIMEAGGAATLVGMVPLLQPVARAIASISWLCLAYTNMVVHWMASWPLASLEVGRASAGLVVLYYGALIGIIWAVRRRRIAEGAQGQALLHRLGKWFSTHPANASVMAALIAAAIVAWLAVLQLPDGRLHVAFLDVGQGDAILITSPTGRQILVDGGPSPSALTSALGQEMPFWDHSIDLLVMTHPDSDHITGLVEVLDRYRVDGWLDNGQAGGDAVYAACQSRLAESGLTPKAVSSGQRLDLGDGLTLDVVYPPPGLSAGSDTSTNDLSLVLRLAWGGSSFLLTGDLEAAGEKLLLESGQPLASTVLKVGHHGSGGSSSPAFLTAVAPRYAVISVGLDNRFGHPDPDVLQRLADLGSTEILRTDQSGTVEFVTDGRQLWVETER